MTESFIDDLHISRERISYLAKNYNTLEYAQSLRSLLTTVFNDIDFSCYSKIMLHQHLSHSLITYYNGEISLKYQLFRRASRKKLVAAFETRVQDSRVDFLMLNGVSASFEIKSELDNLDKLAKQAANYLKVFEYNYLVIDACHKKNALQILPSSFGILRFTEGKRIVERKACPNGAIDPDAQLSMLTKKELATAFNGNSGRNEIRNRFTNQQINDQFKLVLKSRYRSRWDFVVKYRQEIFPIDLQFFFNRNIEPGLIYNHG